MTVPLKNNDLIASQRWEEATRLFEELLPLSPDERRRILLEKQDPLLKNLVESLLSSHEKAPDFLEKVPEISSGPKLAKSRPDELPLNQVVGDFELLEVLGQGGFATVYKAKQLSLARTVALKIAQDEGSEAKTIAQLEHDHIISVFSESVDKDRGLRFICMQFVPGYTMEQVIGGLSYGTGRLDFFDVAIQLVDALAHAHSKGVIHADIKPANILIHPEGRAYLLDFNVARDYSQPGSKQSNPLGGTFEYMAPEQWDLYFWGTDKERLNRLGVHTDIFSIGLVLKEWFQKGGFLNSPNSELERLLERCSALSPEERVGSAVELSKALKGCRDLIQIERAMPLPGFIEKAGSRYPLWTLTLGGFVIQFLASLVSVAYNQANIVSRLDLVQQAAFEKLLLIYNPFCFVVGMGLWAMGLRPLARHLNGIASGPVVSLRQRVVRLPIWVAWLSLGSWMPGSLIFPAVLHFGYGPLPTEAAIHLFISFLLSCAVALSYGVMFADYLTIRSLYPRFWDPRENIRPMANQELSPALKRLRICQFLIAGVPMLGALIMVALGPDELTPDRYQFFSTLLALLILIGATGIYFAIKASYGLIEAYYALTRQRTF